MLIKDTPDVSNEFTPDGRTLRDFFGSDNRGFYIPLYQRPYSWNNENVEQLMDDLVKGIESTLTSAQSVSFLGTVILCQEQNKKKNIEPVDIQALPGLVHNVIDGQQRISTLAMLATRIYRKTALFLRDLDGDFYESLVDHLEGQLTDLKKYFCFTLATKKAVPSEKPVIIRGSHDEWTLDGYDEKYTSPVSNYLAQFIRGLEKGGIDIPDKRTTLGRNLKLMDEYIDVVLNAHKQVETHINYPDAKRILSCIDQELIWKFDREEYRAYIASNDYADSSCSNLASGVQLCIFYHYFFERACLSIIYPSSEDWAFDIFQSLNATGTPLTAIETFKPLVVNTVNRYPYGKYKASESEKFFSAVDELYQQHDTAEKKSKLTKEFLNVFRLVYEGKSLSNHFSQQRKWLNDIYLELSTQPEQEEFLHRLSDLAKYWSNVKWFDSSSMTCFVGLNNLSDREKELTVLSVRYLDDASHRMADTLLSRFYALVIREVNGADKKFAEVSKALASFFTLWRAAYSNTGLDEVYRNILEASDDDEIPNYAWTNGAIELSVTELKEYLCKILNARGIGDKASWLQKSHKNLRYDTAKTVCKFALLVSAHDTIPDANHAGLMKKGAFGKCKYLFDGSWRSSDLKTIEHVAPQVSENTGWDEDIYKDQLEHSVGNLTLLPVDINSSVGNRPWKEKIYYYRHLALDDPDKRSKLNQSALHDGIKLATETLELLTSAQYADHISPIVALAESNIEWDKSLIEERSKRICEILWDDIREWLD